MIDPHLVGIEIRHLRYFLAVCEELHLGRAALRLGMTQPPLGRAIRALEAGLGVILFQRSSRGVMPTAAGKALAVEARKLVEAFDFAVAEARRIGRSEGKAKRKFTSA
jgi:DNA-binding transcriptional LysR family regulator